MTQIKAFDPYIVGKGLKRNQPSQETLQVQEQLLNSIIEAREEELKRDVAGSIDNTRSTKEKKNKKQQPANSQKKITVKSGSKPVIVNRIESNY